MRIGIDATTWWNQRGFGRFTRQLVGAILDLPRPHQFVLFVDRQPVNDMLRDNASAVVVGALRTVTDAAVADSSRSVRDVLAFRRAARSQKLDAFYFPAVYSWFPIGRGVASVVTFHDAIAEHFPDLVMPRLQNRLLWKAKVQLAKRSATAITTVSHAARRELTTYLRIPEDEIHVIHEAADPAFQPVVDRAKLLTIRRKLEIPTDRLFLLYVGGLAPHKNLVGITKAYARAREAGKLVNVDLVLAGDPKGGGFHSNAHEIMALATRDPWLHGRVHFPGFVADEDLPGLYSDALGVLMPAYSEGFGLPAAEAVACGTPVLATQGGSVAEFVGDAGLYFDPHSVEDMSRVLIAYAENEQLQSQLRANCARRAAALSWDRAAAETLDVIETAAGRI